MKKLIVIPIFLFSQILISRTACYENYEWCMSWARAYYDYDVGQCGWWNSTSCEQNARSTYYGAMDDCEDGYYQCRHNEM